MVLIVDGHKFHYEMENLCRVFFPYEKIKVVYDDSFKNINEEIVIATKLLETNSDIQISIFLKYNDYTDLIENKLDKDLENKEYELKMAQALFNVLSQYTDYTPGWGILTGVRPSKLMLNLIKETGTENAFKYFKNELFVSESNIKLLQNVVCSEEKIIKQLKPNSCSLYISIPFCPSRCSYCSFVSHSITSASAKKLIPEYVKLLFEELQITAEIINNLNLRLESIYVGGGTPTILDCSQINELLNIIINNYDITTVKEFTFEAGRPDTITDDKLTVLKNSPVSRISINPQTLNDNVLEIIGRKHTTGEFLDAYNLARKYKLNNINMDLIAGLPGDTLESFQNTIDNAVLLNPEGITVHTLAMKRSSSINSENLYKNGKLTSEMVNYAKNKLTESCYTPYYMYRQSKSLGNLENVGWCKKGFDGLYNIYMMEECHSVFAVGAGAVTKLKDNNSDYIERIFNFKYPYEYIERFEELIKRKDNIKKFYSTI